MRLHIRFHLKRPLNLPIAYSHILQAFIYNLIEDKEFSRFLHDEGFIHNKRRFRLFTFSRLLGRASVDRKNKMITFKDKVDWQIASCNPKFIKEIGQSLLMKSSLHLIDIPLEIEELQYKNTDITQTSCYVRMISPITVHSTYQSQDGRKTTQYFSPYDPAFSHLITENLAKKYEAYFNQSMNAGFSIKPIRFGKKDKVVTRFKGIVIEAWNGVYELQGPPEVLNFACAAGLGSRNSQGFGMPEIQLGVREAKT